MNWVAPPWQICAWVDLIYHLALAGLAHAATSVILTFLCVRLVDWAEARKTRE